MGNVARFRQETTMPDDRTRRTSVHVLHLVDTTTGQPLRLAGHKLTVLARDPVIGARELMRGRDPARWIVQSKPAGIPVA